MFQLIKKLFKPKSEFHRFSQLPQEIQNLICAYALCVDTPRAYFVDVEATEHQRRLRIAHSIPESLGSFPLLPASISNSDYDLMRVFRASYQEITRCWSLYRPQVPAGMILDSSHDNSTRVNGKRSLYIGDLIIVERWCQGINLVSGFQGVVNFWPNAPYDGLEGIRRVAIPVDDDLDYYTDSRYLNSLKAVFPGIRTRYFYTQPDQLVPLGLRHQGLPVDFLAAKLLPGEEPTETFMARGRMFYEICPEEIKRAADRILVAPWERGERRRRRRRNGIPRIKFVTWQ
ncbi:hypothetical protein FACUT_12426 [Fusarium acutatum]|uniref:Uncharacterized protein n=1 Tax=Fusarium acutatum TaxID=78861 RepID=A0A8H4JCJ8_9HYPO|nr:hypothetical protein FACUT_12426 [Fusarium acutatum]